MKRVNHRRVEAAMQYAVRTWLEQTPMGRGAFLPSLDPKQGWGMKQVCMGATSRQIKAAAKQMVKSGFLPAGMKLQRRFQTA